MKSIFVTGGAGFIGSAFIRLILGTTRDVEIVNFDALTYAGSWENLRGVDERRHKFVKGDIRTASQVLDAIPANCDAIFNFAAESHVDRSIHSAHDFISTNILGTQILLDAAREKNVRRFVQISTDEVMGSLPDNDQLFFTEESPLRPNSPYAASKAGAEFVVRAAHETFGLDVVITRCGNNYGPYQFPEKLIPLMIVNAINEESLPVYGDGRNVRDWIYVDDHCRAIWEIYERGKSGDVYNIGARNERKNIDVVKFLLDALGKPQSLIRFVNDRPGHDLRYAIDPTKIETELGWSPQVSWRKGMAKTIKWYLENKTWVDHARNGSYHAYYKKMYGAGAG
jgi:dTDP-glucose 4,6-dehydratase